MELCAHHVATLNSRREGLDVEALGCGVGCDWTLEGVREVDKLSLAYTG